MREAPFEIEVPASEISDSDSKEKILIQGVIDCYFYENDQVIIVDYKSDYYENVFLPFKYGAVAMAKETGATIVPFAVNNNYFTSDPLIVRAGKPMKVNVEDDLEEKTSELRDEIKTMVWENAEYEKTLKLKK